MFGFQLQPEKNKIEHSLKKTRQAWFGPISQLFQHGSLNDDLWDQLEELLISADLGVTITQKLIQRLRNVTKTNRINMVEEALGFLKHEMVSMLTFGSDVGVMEAKKPPFVLLVVGVNGVGKTTSIAKLANWFKADGKSVIIGAGDTYRAAAIDQLQIWGSRLDIDVIAHQPGADSAAVTFDTIQAGLSRRTDVVIIDTAGRLHTKGNLMEELKKSHRVITRQKDKTSHAVLLTLDATTGQNGLNQARSFAQAVKCDGVFLSKMDGTSKGGIALAVAEDLKLPVLFVGVGEEIGDIITFNPHDFVQGLFI